MDNFQDFSGVPGAKTVTLPAAAPKVSENPSASTSPPKLRADFSVLSFITSESTEKLDAALAVAQGEMEDAIKNTKNPHFKSTFADLASVWHACRDPLSKAGIAVTQWPIPCALGRFALVTRIAHQGEWMQSGMEVLIDKSTAQAAGSAMTYLRRYMLMAVAGIAPAEENSPGDANDDDGNEASGISGGSRSAPQVIQPRPSTASNPFPVDQDPREHARPPGPAQAAPGGAPVKLAYLTEAQIKRLYTIADASGWSHEQCRLYLKHRWNLDSSKDLNRDQYEAFISLIQATPYAQAMIMGFR